MLYQHDLYLVRADAPEPLFASLDNSGLLRADDVTNRVVLPGGARALVQEGTLPVGGGTVVQIAALLIEDEDVELFTRDFGALVSWLDDVGRLTDLLVAFMPGGPDASGTPDLEQFLTAVLDEGRVVTPPALIWVSSAVADGALCVADRPPYRTVRASELGCLFALVDIAADGSFEVLEPGPDVTHLRSAWSAVD